TLWSVDGKWTKLADTLNRFIGKARYYGLFPSDYNYETLSSLQTKLQSDTLLRKDAAFWSRVDILLTDALFLISRHLKRGRLPFDTLTSRKDTPVLNDDFYLGILDEVIRTN